MYDQRLFNQTSGLDAGFGEEDDYTLYDKPLFADRTQASIYKNVKEIALDEDQGGETTDVKKVLNQKPSRGFEGTDYTKGARTKPVEFEKKRLAGDDNEFGKTGLQEPISKRPKHE